MTPSGKLRRQRRKLGFVILSGHKCKSQPPSSTSIHPTGNADDKIIRPLDNFSYFGMFFYIWDEDPARVNFSVDQSSKLYLRDTWAVLGGYYLYQRETWRETVPLANLDTSRELLDLIHDDDHQVTAPTPSLGSHGSGEGDSTYFTGERPSPHHLSVLSKFHSFTRFSAKAFQPVHSEGRRPPESLKPSYTRQDLIRSTRPHVQ